MLAQAPGPGVLDRLFQLSPLTPWWELMLRGAVVYVFLIVLIRMTGRRQVGMLAPFDFILLLILSNAVQNSMNAGDNTLGGGLLIATTLVLLNALMSALSRRSKWLEGILVGRPVFLIREGAVQEEALRQEKVTHHELSAALRAAGCPNIEAARHAILETNGSITIVHKEPA
jgi:uncharacterized membrane protein YcaP (DUF421 family)